MDIFVCGYSNILYVQWFSSFYAQLITPNLGRAKNKRREPEELKTFININDSLMRLDSNVLQVCDSILAETKDSLTYYDYYILKARYFLLANNIDSVKFYVNRTRNFTKKISENAHVIGLKSITNSTEASYYHLFKQEPYKAIALNLLAYDQILRSDIVFYAPEIAANLADTYIAIDDLPKGAKWYRRALFLVDSLGLPPIKKVTLYMGLAQIYTDMHDYASARRLYEMSEHQFNKMKPNMQSYYLNNYGNYYYYTEDYKNALKIFRRLKRHLQDSNANGTFDMYLCKINMSDIFLNLGMTDSAKVYVNAAEEYFKKHSIDVGIYYANTIKIGIFLKEGRYKEIEDILRTERFADKINQNIKNIRSRYLRKYYATIGNYKMAYNELLNNISQNDSLEHNRENMKASEIMMRYTEDTLKLHHQIELNRKNVEINKSRAILWLLISIALAFASIIGFGLILIRKRKLKTKMTILLLRLNIARQRISPHFVFNVLNSGIKSMSEEETDRLMRLTKLIRASLDMTGKAYVSLYEELNFIKEYLLLEHSLIGNDFNVIYNIPEESVQNKIRIPAMFIQILVENAIKHGLKNVEGYKKLEINIDHTVTATTIKIIDNGPGFDIRKNSNTRSKNGLNIIRQTISIINYENYGMSKIQFKIKNIEDENGHVIGCNSTLIIPNAIKFI